MPESEAPAGWILYDGECGLCNTWAARYGPAFERAGYRLAPLQEDWVRRRLGFAEGEIPDEMKLLTADGRVLGGADAFIHLAPHIPVWGRILRALAFLPGGKCVLRAGYRSLAKRRHRSRGSCPLPRSRS